jgi:hypothetical protein
MIGDMLARLDLTFELVLRRKSRSIVSGLNTNDQVERYLCSLELSMEICVLLWDSSRGTLGNIEKSKMES